MNNPYFPESMDINATLAALMVIAAFSLASLIIGVFIGQSMKVPIFSPSKRRSSTRKRSSRSSSGAAEIYIGNLPYDMTEKDVRKVFMKYGKVKSVRLIKNRFNGKSKGFGFIEMGNAKQGCDAIDALHNKDLNGRRVIVNEAKSSARD